MKKKMIYGIGLLAAIATIALSGQKYLFDRVEEVEAIEMSTDAEGDCVEIEKIIIKNSSVGEINLKKGKTKALKVTIISENVTDTQLEWSSSNEKIATVSDKGVVSGKKAGMVNITAKAKDGSEKKASVKIKVVPAKAVIYKTGFYYYGITTALKEKMNGKSYKKNNKILYSDLRYISIKHYGYDGKLKTGELVVNKKIAKDIVEIFYELYQKKYPIQKMKLIDNYNADDTKSMEANNTSAFNYRTVSNGTTLSKHAYGLAIDINPRINPYVTNEGKNVSPSNGSAYAERNVSKCSGKYKKNMIHKNDVIYKIFRKHGFSWGGDWVYSKDYQHFEKK